ncbi:MAG: hypothetical protein KY391_00345 [Actinobacteria bacterium]|nr:hypothetical protein [Actinomycetota bacterium]
MKRAVVALFAVVLGATALPAGADPGVYTEAGQMAMADWVVMHSPTHGTLYFAGGMRSASSDRPPGTLGMVGSGDCRVKRGNGWTIVMCEGSGRAKYLGIDEFEFDPAMRSASLSMKARGVKNVVKWRGRGRVPGTGASVYADDSMVGVDVGSGRMASVKARVLGEEMPRRGWMNFAFLVEGAGAFAWENSRSKRSFELGPDGTYTYSVTLRFRR